MRPDQERRLLRVARKYSDELGISDQEFNCLVCGSGEVPTVPLSSQEIDQLSRIVRIYIALHSLFTNRDQANSWLHRSNEYFGSRTGLEEILSEPSTKIEEVAKYLEYQRV